MPSTIRIRGRCIGIRNIETDCRGYGITVTVGDSHLSRSVNWCRNGVVGSEGIRAVGLDLDVGRLKVAVNDPGLVRYVHARGHVPRVAQRLLEVHRFTVGDLPGQRV